MAMAAALSPSALSSHFSSSLSLQRLSFVTSTSYGAQPRIGAREGRNSHSIAVRAQQQEGERRERDEVSELENALGIENKTVRNVSSDKNAPQRRLFSIPVPCCLLSVVRLCLQSSKRR